MGQAKTLTDREFVRVLEFLNGKRHEKRNRLMLCMTHYAGFRVGEVANLKLLDVLDSEGHVREQVTLMPDQTKGSRERVVFLPAKLRLLIAEYIKQAKPKVWLFKSQKGGKFSPNTLQATMTRLYERAGFTGCSSHSGRRSFLTKLASQGVSVRVLQELAGHRHIGTTQRYIDVNDEMKRSALLLI